MLNLLAISTAAFCWSLLYRTTHLGGQGWIWASFPDPRDQHLNIPGSLSLIVKLIRMIPHIRKPRVLLFSAYS